MKVFVLNGWAGSPLAWKNCSFGFDRIYSCNESLDGVFERDLVSGQGAVCVGWSMGGGILLETLVRHPRLVKGMVLVAATPRMMRDENWKGMTERRIAALRRGLDATLSGVVFDAGEDVSFAYEGDTEENLSRGLGYLRTLDCREALGAYSAKGLFDALPVRILQGSRDAVVAPENAGFLSSVFPRAKTVMIDSSSHALPATHPAAIDSAVSAVLAECGNR